MRVFNAYTQFVLSRLYSNPQHRAGPVNVQSTLSISNHGRISLEPSQATASKHWSLPSVRVRVEVRVRVGWYLLTWLKQTGCTH